MINYDQLVESIQEWVEKDVGLNTTLRSTVQVLINFKSPLVAFLSGIIDFAITSNQEANRLRCLLLVPLEKLNLEFRPLIKEESMPLNKVSRQHMDALKLAVLDQKPHGLKTFIVEILIKESQLAADEMMPLMDTLRRIWSLQDGDSTQFSQAIKAIVLVWSS